GNPARECSFSAALSPAPDASPDQTGYSRPPCIRAGWRCVLRSFSYPRPRRWRRRREDVFAKDRGNPSGTYRPLAYRNRYGEFYSAVKECRWAFEDRGLGRSRPRSERHCPVARSQVFAPYWWGSAHKDNT